MYELVNTSVPNGLVSGTHGYATVAVTKGTPDAVRQRIEGFCAYPHRTSAHDASYFAENPVNWFHLVTPGGEHVVGRTAPAEFDYTGRTNRVSRVLYFPEREMPSAGGAAVLLAESDRFCEGWSGEPRYLPADAGEAERLRRTERPSAGGAPHWTQMFGAEGETLARRFAALLAQNVRSGKGIFFKAAKADVDGRRLLGLFSDLIALVPEGVAAQVTFSTFAACVPGGVSCLLRGIYDSDRAFETMAALQPWVDCESGRVRNIELLPPAAETVASAPLSYEAIAESGRDGVPPPSAAGDGTPALPRSRGNAIASHVTERPVVVGRPMRRPSFASGGASRICVKKSNDAAFYWILGVVATLVVVLAVGIVLYILEPWKKGRGEDESRLAAQVQASEELDNWFADCTNDVARLRARLDACETSKDAERLLKQAKDNKHDLAASADEAGLVGYEDRLRDAERQYDKLVNDIQMKFERLKSKENSEEEKRRKEETEEEERKKSRDADAQLDDMVAKAVEKQNKDIQAAKKVAEVPFGEINVAEVFGSDKNEKWTARLSDKDKEKLTNECSIVYYFPSGGKVERISGCVEVRKANNLGYEKKVTQKFIVDEPKDVESARWYVVSIPSLGKAYWQWRPNSKEPIALFKDGDSADLAKVAFDGCQDEALEVYQRFLRQKSRELIYVVSWEDAAKPLRVNDAELSIERFKPDAKADKEDFESLKKKISDKEEAIGNRKTDLQRLEGKFDELKNLVEEYNELAAKKRVANKLEDKKDKEKKDKAKKEASDGMERLKKDSEALLKECGFRGKTIDKISVEECDRKIDKLRKDYEKDIARMEEEKESLNKQLKSAEEASSADWREACKKRLYVVEVAMDGGGSDDEGEE